MLARTSSCAASTASVSFGPRLPFAIGRRAASLPPPHQSPLRWPPRAEATFRFRSRRCRRRAGSACHRPARSFAAASSFATTVAASCRGYLSLSLSPLPPPCEQRVPSASAQLRCRRLIRHYGGRLVPRLPHALALVAAAAVRAARAVGRRAASLPFALHSWLLLPADLSSSSSPQCVRATPLPSSAAPWARCRCSCVASRAQGPPIFIVVAAVRAGDASFIVGRAVGALPLLVRCLSAQGPSICFLFAAAQGRRRVLSFRGRRLRPVLPVPRLRAGADVFPSAVAAAAV